MWLPAPRHRPPALHLALRPGAGDLPARGPAQARGAGDQRHAGDRNARGGAGRPADRERADGEKDPFAVRRRARERVPAPLPGLVPAHRWEEPRAHPGERASPEARLLVQRRAGAGQGSRGKAPLPPHARRRGATAGAPPAGRPAQILSRERGSGPGLGNREPGIGPAPCFDSRFPIPDSRFSVYHSSRMRISTEQLQQQLARELKPLYTVFGDETLLALEAADRIRARARAEGYTERNVLTADSGFKWSELAFTGSSQSLFAARRVLEVRVPSGKPGTDGSAALQAYCENPPPDTVTLVTLPGIEWRAQKAGRFEAPDRRRGSGEGKAVARKAL